MYETCLRNWIEVEDAMTQGYPVAGAFKSTAAFQTAQYKWHYSGSFWWARSQKLFENRLWQEMCNRWWGFESYVGRHFTRQEGYCLFRPLYRGEALYAKEGVHLPQARFCLPETRVGWGDSESRQKDGFGGGIYIMYHPMEIWDQKR
ncbi:MAG: hypothetical protein EBY77_08835 [Rhodobacteraceae bacterium]|nr:hypothetical protein [Paracoccaceae bacterium]